MNINSVQSIKICPSMLSADPGKLCLELIDIEKAGADCIHWDIMDGNFVDAITFGSHVVSKLRKLTSLRFDVHLMIENPEKHIEKFAQAGADVIIVHPEACNHLHRCLSLIKNLKKIPGVALNPATPIESIKYCIDILSLVLVMSVNPGSSGQTFIESQMKKISELRKLLSDTVEICIDGGINPSNIQECVKNGANSFVSGAYIFNSENYYEAIQKLREKAYI